MNLSELASINSLDILLMNPNSIQVLHVKLSIWKRGKRRRYEDEAKAMYTVN